MEKIVELFEKYKPIKSIYENDSEYICFPKVEGEPLVVYFDKKLKQFKEIYFYERANISTDLEYSKLIYGENLDFSDNKL